MRLLCTLLKHLTKFGIEVMISNSSTMEKTFWTATFRGVVCCSVVVCRRCSLWNFSCWWRAAAGWGRSILTLLPDRYASFLNKKSQKQPTSVKIIAKKFIYGGGNLKGEMHATFRVTNSVRICAHWCAIESQVAHWNFFVRISKIGWKPIKNAYISINLETISFYFN